MHLLWLFHFLILTLSAPGSSIVVPGNSSTGVSVYSLQPVALTNECKHYVAEYCSRHSQSDWATIDCLQKDDSTLRGVSEECQNLLWKRKQIMTHRKEFEESVPSDCRLEFDGIKSCQGSAFYVPCLVEHKSQVKSAICLSYLNKAASFIFADYRLIFNFVQFCKNDLRRFSCGRLEIGPESPSQELEHLQVKSQGRTIQCLGAHIEKLESGCLKQILRVAELQSDDYHLDRPLYYACREDRERLCPSVESGSGLVYACLKKHKYHPMMSENCSKMLLERQRLRAVDFFIDYRLSRACAVDISKGRCHSTDLKNPDVSLSGLMLCLEAVGKPQSSNSNELTKTGNLQPECSSELDKLRTEMLDDYRLSPNLLLHCNVTIEQHCASKKNGRGTVLHCLLHSMRSYKTERPSAECETAVHELLKATNVEENAILDKVIDDACRPILATKCAGLEQKGHGYLFECLSNNLRDPDMTHSCRSHILELSYFVTRDVTLDDNLHRACAEDSLNLCNVPKIVWAEHNRPDAHLLTCLYNHRPSLIGTGNKSHAQKTISDQCRSEVMRIVHLRAASVSLEPRVFKVCLADLAMCDEEEDDDDEEDEDNGLESPSRNMDGVRGSQGSKRSRPGEHTSSGLACLQERLPKLDPKCRKAVIEVSAEAHEDPNLDKMISEACVSTEARLCSDVHPPSEMLQCLIRHKNHPDMDPDCRVAVQHMQLVALKDIQISPELRRSCLLDAQSYCKSEISNGAAAVVVCLSAQLTAHKLFSAKQADKTSHLSQNKPIVPPLSAACYKTLVNQLYERSETISLDPDLASACEMDRRRLCGTVMEGDAKVLDCLRDHRDELSPSCHAKVFLRDQLMAFENKADYSLWKHCGRMIRTYCPPAPPYMDYPDEVDHQINHHALIECLTVAIDREAYAGHFDPICREHIVEITSIRYKDYRLDPELQTVCGPDIARYCSFEAEATLKNPYEQNGPVLHCLRRHFVQHSNTGEYLSVKCYRRVRLLVKWENTLHHLDPTLASVCKSDLLNNCPHHLTVKNAAKIESLDRDIRECLLESFKNKKLKSPSCITEVTIMVEETKTDLYVDVILHQACAMDVQRICGEVEPGQGRQIACLLRALDRTDASSVLGAVCFAQLTKRRELWNYVAEIQRPDSLSGFIYQLKTSHARTSVLVSVFFILSIIFTLGLCCGRVTHRVPVDVKIK